MPPAGFEPATPGLGSRNRVPPLERRKVPGQGHIDLSIESSDRVSAFSPRISSEISSGHCPYDWESQVSHREAASKVLSGWLLTAIAACLLQLCCQVKSQFGVRGHCWRTLHVLEMDADETLPAVQSPSRSKYPGTKSPDVASRSR